MNKELTCIPDSFIYDCLRTFKEEQLTVLEEECSELIQACTKIKRKKDLGLSFDTKNLAEEMAHVLISLEVIACQYNVKHSDIMKQVAYKAIKHGFDISAIPYKEDAGA